MATKVQNTQSYRRLPGFLRDMREEAGLSQRQIGEKLRKPQSFIYNCETANRRVDLVEFIAWVEACGVDPQVAFRRFLKS